MWTGAHVFSLLLGVRRKKWLRSQMVLQEGSWVMPQGWRRRCEARPTVFPEKKKEKKTNHLSFAR